MKVASITIYCNEHFRLENWVNLYSEYKGEIYKHVIVNNGNASETRYLRECFPNSIILESATNNMMSSYNLALKEILKDPDVDSVMQICNDIRIEKGGVTKLYDFLNSNDRYTMVSPILLKKDSDIIDSYGADINRYTLSYIHKYSNKRLAEVKDDFVICDGLPAGVFMAKRNQYEQYGFQDEKICMYADEVDMSINAHRYGYLFAATKNIKSWHQHVYSPGKVSRSGSSYYYLGRNHIYIAKKQCGYFVIACTIISRFFQFSKSVVASFIHKDGRLRRENAKWFFKGIWDALLGV